MLLGSHSLPHALKYNETFDKSYIYFYDYLDYVTQLSLYWYHNWRFTMIDFSNFCPVCDSDSEVSTVVEIDEVYSKCKKCNGDFQTRDQMQMSINMFNSNRENRQWNISTFIQ